MKKRGFTLIELLAVVIVLSIILLVAVPIVRNIRNKAKEKALYLSSERYLDAVELAIMQENMNNGFNPTKCNIQQDGNLLCDGRTLQVEVKGETPTSGTITFKDLNVEDVNIIIEGKTIAYDSAGNIINTEPELTDNSLVPVVYNGTNWIVAKTDEQWYNYLNQEWANAVLLKSSVEKDVGDPVTVEGSNPDALAMFVWIPRFEYKIEGSYGTNGTQSLPGEIKVNLIPVDKTEPTEGYTIHPAFTFDNEQLAGMWVGKFETSHTTLGLTDNDLGCTDENCAVADGLRILPNKTSVINNSVSYMFFASRSMSRNGNTFGLDSDSYNVHMMKNSEWGAVAYLSQSKYGKYGNSDYTGVNKEIYFNSAQSDLTGKSTGMPSTTQINAVRCSYNDITNRGNGTGSCGGGASTTGNITGVYDMSGGVAEYMMGSYRNDATKLVSSSGFTSMPAAAYYNVYTSTDGSKACNNGICFGHALSETAGWYNNSFNSPAFGMYYEYPLRGGVYNNKNVGIFSWTLSNGYRRSYGTFRVIMTPKSTSGGFLFWD